MGLLAGKKAKRPLQLQKQPRPKESLRLRWQARREGRRTGCNTIPCWCCAILIGSVQSVTQKLARLWSKPPPPRPPEPKPPAPLAADVTSISSPCSLLAARRGAVGGRGWRGASGEYVRVM